MTCPPCTWPVANGWPSVAIGLDRPRFGRLDLSQVARWVGAHSCTDKGKTMRRLALACRLDLAGGGARGCPDGPFGKVSKPVRAKSFGQNHNRADAKK